MQSAASGQRQASSKTATTGRVAFSLPTRQDDLPDCVVAVNSAVFHLEGCKSAAKILAENLVTYKTREEAVQAGKRPCAECKP